MKILTIGNKGQLGTSIEKLMIEKSFKDVLFVDLPDFDLTQENNVKDCILDYKPGIIINCAAYTAVDKAEEEQEKANLVNSLGVKWIGKYSSQIKSKVIHISTDYVFEGNSNIPLSPEDQTNPQSVYGKTKLEGEQNLFAENPNSLIIRTSWLYSPYGNNFVKTMLNLGEQKDEINVVIDQIGTPTYAMDLASVIVMIAEKTQKNDTYFAPGIYHYSNEGVCSWYDFALMIFKKAGIKCIVNPILSVEYPTLAQRPKFSVLNLNLIKTQFNITIPQWKESLEKCLKEMKIIT